jgi:sodium/proline symporter
VTLSFLIILTVIAIIGLSAGRFSKPNQSDYYLASKSLSPWIVGLSAMATNNSGYMFIGLIGFTYLVGLPSIWLMIGWILGDFLISKTIHKKINQETSKNSNITYASVIGAWANQGKFITKFIGLLSLIFLIVYASAQFVSGGKTLMVIFDWDLWLGISIGSVIVFMYTLVGGIRASIWTDVIQAIIMVVSMIILVVSCFLSLGGINIAFDKWLLVDNYLNFFPREIQHSFFLKFIYPISWIVAGFFVIGQPHIMVRFMALKDPQLIERARAHYYFWYLLFYFLAFCVGMLSRIYLGNQNAFDPELALPLMALELLNPFMVGVIIAGIFAATMSTADSLIINCSGNISQDLFKSKNFSSTQIKLITFVVALIATTIALLNNNSVFSIVIYAWTLLGISFAPLIIILSMGNSIEVKTYMVGLLIGIVSFFLINHYGINKFIYAGFIPFSLNLSYIYLKRQLKEI